MKQSARKRQVKKLRDGDKKIYTPKSYNKKFSFEDLEDQYLNSENQFYS